MKKTRAAKMAIGLFALMAALAPAPAYAAVSEGHSQTCDSQGSCLVAGAYTAESPTRSIGECYGVAPGAVEMRISCWTDGLPVSMVSSGGPTNRVTLISNDAIRTLCWEVTATYVTNPGSELITSGCTVEVI